MPSTPDPVQTPETSKMALMWLILGAVVLAAGLWWWMSRSEMASAPTPTPAAQTDADVRELNSINANENLDAEFQQIDQDLNNL